MTHQNELPIGLTERLADAPTPNVVMARPARRGITIAIDPGASGGFAICYPDGMIALYAMPEADTDRIDLITSAQAQAAIEGVLIQAVMEQVTGYVAPKKSEGDRFRQPGSAMFNFGEGFGFLRGAVLALGIPLRMVSAKQWQKGLWIGTKEDRATRKRALKAKAQEMFPALKPTLKTCDALLILDWANRCL